MTTRRRLDARSPRPPVVVRAAGLLACALAAGLLAVLCLLAFLTVAAGFGADSSLDGGDKVLVGIVQLAALAAAVGGLAAALGVVHGRWRLLLAVFACLALAVFLQDAAWDLRDHA